MKVFYASESIIPSPNANTLQVLRMADAFAACAAEVTLFGWKSARESQLADIRDDYQLQHQFRLRLIACSERSVPRWIYATKVAWTARREQPVFVYARCPYSAYMVTRFGIPTVLELHALPKPQSRFAKQLLPYLLSASNLIAFVCITNQLADDLRTTFACSEKPLWVFPDGAKPYRPLPVASKDQLDRRKLLVGYMGSLHPGKGMEIIVPLARECPDVNFVVVGGEPNQVSTWTSQCGDLPNLRFLGRLTPREALAASAEFDIALLPNQINAKAIGGTDIGRWTSPLKAFEYMSLGKPILASDLPVLREVLVDQVNAILVKADSVDAWRQALYQLLSDPVLRRSLGDQARCDLERKYTWDKRAEQIIAKVSSELNLATSRPTMVCS